MTGVASFARSPLGLRLVSLAIVLVAWESLGRLSPRVASHPTAIASAFVELAFVDNTLLPAFWVTLQGLAVGFVIAAVLGVVIGYAMGRIRLVDLILDPYVSALYATPRIALVPLLVLWVGIDFELRLTIVVLSAVFPIIINTYIGAKNVDRELLDAGRAFAANGWQLLTTVVLPGSLPYLFAGLRIGVARGIVGIIVAEMTAAVTGTGQLIIQFGRFFQTDRLFVPVIILGLFSIVLAELVYFLQRRSTPWARVERIR
jgi:ABC-type nitrate/sulfonate/bicarbonate transport system permease component